MLREFRSLLLTLPLLLPWFSVHFSGTVLRPAVSPKSNGVDPGNGSKLGPQNLEWRRHLYRCLQSFCLLYTVSVCYCDKILSFHPSLYYQTRTESASGKSSAFGLGPPKLRWIDATAQNSTPGIAEIEFLTCLQLLVRHQEGHPPTLKKNLQVLYVEHLLKHDD